MDCDFSLRGHRYPVTAIAFCADPQLRPEIISGDEAGFLMVWDLDLRRPRKTWQAHGSTILSLHAYKDTIITQGRDNSIRLWKDGVETDTLPCESLHFAQFRVHADKLVFCVPSPARICVYCLADQSFWFIPLDLTKGACTALACGSMGIWAGYEDGSCVLYGLTKNAERVDGLVKHTEPILNLSLLGSECLSSGADSSIHNQSTPSPSMTLGAPGVSCMLALSRFCVVLVGWDGVIRLLKDRKSVFEVIEHRKSIRCVSRGAVHLRGRLKKLVAFGSEDMRISVWSLRGEDGEA